MAERDSRECNRVSACLSHAERCERRIQSSLRPSFHVPLCLTVSQQIDHRTGYHYRRPNCVCVVPDWVVGVPAAVRPSAAPAGWAGAGAAGAVGGV